jgi:hypothetical protein
MVVPSGQTYATALPAGSHPLLDPLFSSEWLTFDHHGLELGRSGKVADLLARHPELLSYLKVCYTESHTGNCGRCRKCLWTMIALQAAGGLQRASLFPDAIDVDAISHLRIPDLLQRLFWMQTAESLGDTTEERRVRDAVRHALRRSARPSLTERIRGVLAWMRSESARPASYWSTSPSAQLRNQTNVALAALRVGVPYPYGIESATPQPVPAWSVGRLEPGWAPPLDSAPSLVGLLRLLDRRGRRHLYAVGVVPPLAGVERIGELGALLRHAEKGSVPVWVDADGRLRTNRYSPRPIDLSPRVLVRWSLAPVRWSDLGSWASRLTEVARRTLDAFAALRGGRTCAWASAGAPVGHLFSEDGDRRLPLFSTVHPVTGDQLLSTEDQESADLGYNDPVLLGYLQASAPTSGTLGVMCPFIPWASRFGQQRSD